MALAGDTIDRALRILCVKDAAESTKAADFASGVLALNQMLRRWEANGLQLGWTDVANPLDVMPCPDEALEAIAYNLALRMRPEYGVEVGADVVQMASDGLALLRMDWNSKNFARLTYDDLPMHPMFADRAAFLAGY